MSQSIAMLISWLVEHRARLLAGLALAALAAGGALHLAGQSPLGDAVWLAVLAILSGELAIEVLRTVMVKRHMGVDTIALLAMLGALALDELVAGLVIGLMFSGGLGLEEAASSRARRELTMLVGRAPKVAHLSIDGRGIRDVPVETVEVGEVMMVRTGEVVPIDGNTLSVKTVIDTSALTGEPLPVTLTRGMPVMSGTANIGPPFKLRADRPAAESAYAALVRLVESTAAERAPLVRIADRYAGLFLAATVLVAGMAWALSGNAVRALAVLVVATPCPLILAAPIALISGLSRAARDGIVIKGAGVIEALGQIRTVLFDKTGTLTVGSPALREIVTREGIGDAELLRLAASVDQMSAHVLGEALMRAAKEADLVLSSAADVHEDPGQGIVGTVEGRRVAVGSRIFLESEGVPEGEIQFSPSSGRGSGEARVHVALDGHLSGVITLADELRPEARGIVERLRSLGVRQVAVVSGDRSSVAEQIGGQLGVDRVYAEQSPQDKLELVRQLSDDHGLSPVMMVGDGINDAPALAIADVGIAMGAAGATVSSETADAVITVDRIDRVADAVHIGRRALLIARQSIFAGMGLSIVAMGVAAFGYLPPVAGALLQEGIDLAVILNALRALRG